MNRQQASRVGTAFLQPGEKVISVMRPSWRYYARFFILPLAGSVVTGPETPLVFCMILITLLLVLLSMYSHLFIITSQRVVEQTGLISRNTAQSCLTNIQLINTRQGIVDRLFMVGDVKIESAAHNGRAGDIVFGGVAEPVEVKELIFKLKYPKKRNKQNPVKRQRYKRR
jgi:uncharacterized membrane protein YdbT with pleckstrin-like domain